MKQSIINWRKNDMMQVTIINIVIMFVFFVLFSYAASFTIKRFTVDYYDEMMYSANDRFSQQFDQVLNELNDLSFHASNQVELISDNPVVKRQALKELINYSPMVDYGFIVDRDLTVQAAVFYGSASSSDYQLDKVNFVDEPYLQQAQSINKSNLLEFLIPLDNEQLHLFIDLNENNRLQDFFHSLSFSNEFYVGIYNEKQELIYSYDDFSETYQEKIEYFYNEEDKATAILAPIDSIHVIREEDLDFIIATQQLNQKGWSLALFVPEVLTQQFMTGIYKTLLPILIVMTLLFLIIILYAYYRSQRPYRALVEAIDVLADGDYTHRIQHTNNNTSIGRINYKFNQMANELEKSQLILQRNEQELAKQKDFLNRIINTSPMMIYTMTRDGVYQLVNDRYAKRFDFKAKEMQGRHALSVTNDIPVTHYHLKLHQSILISNKPTTYEDRQLLSDGSIDWYRVTKQAIDSVSGKDKEILMVATDITEIKENQELIEHQAYHDELTGIGNRKLFKKVVSEAIEQTDQDNEGFAVLFLDLDRFKYVNDTFGHDAGDNLLIDVSNRIQSSINERDYVFRFGGDEFTVLTYFTDDRQQVTDLAKTIIHALTKPYTFNDHSFIVTASIGISLYPKHSQSLNELTKYADLSMYQAKQQGKNTFRFYTPALETEISHQIQLETDLFQALDRDELYVVYQPILDTQTKQICAVEALLRWQHTKLGAIGPNVFIPIALKNGLMEQFSKYLMQEAAQTIAHYNKQHQQPIKLHVNLTEQEFRNEKTIVSIKQQFLMANLSLNTLVIEINEKLSKDKWKDLKERLSIFLTEGIQVAIDSFGDHYLSLRQLNTLPFSIIKLSQDTLHEALNDDDSLNGYTRLISLAKKLKLRIIQEGVETEEEVRFIESMKLNAYQGFFISQPLTKEEFEQDY